MSDYNPNLGPGPGGYDKYGNPRNPDPQLEPGGRGPYILLAILVVIGLIGGLLYFNGTPREGDIAKAPDRTVTTPAPTPPTTPAMPGAPPADRNTPARQ